MGEASPEAGPSPAVPIQRKAHEGCQEMAQGVGEASLLEARSKGVDAEAEAVDLPCDFAVAIAG